MKKILFVATHPLQINGYAKVGNVISNYLADSYEVYYFGFSHYQNLYLDRNIHQNIQLIDVLKEEKKRGFTDNFGVDIIEEFILTIKPDIVFIYNDIIVTCRHLNVYNSIKHKHNFKVISYLDLVYDFENPIYINHVSKSCDRIITFSRHWKINLLTMGVEHNKTDILHHGFDKNIFNVISKYEARKYFNFKPDDFIFLNTNRNSYRKALDITISSFLDFLKRVNFNEKFKLLFNCVLESKNGYNLQNTIVTGCMKRNIDYKYICDKFIHILPSNNILNDMEMNVLYNTCDVGLNTCIGEGFGLCNLEIASIGKPQIVSNVGGLKDIFSDYPEFVIEPVAEYNISEHTDGHNGVAKICASKDFSDRMYDVYINYSKYSDIADKCKLYIHQYYDWNIILKSYNFEF